MSTGIAAIQANAAASVSFLSVNTRLTNKTSGISTTGISQQSAIAQNNAVAKADSVQLSATAQQYLQSSQTHETQAKGLVAQLVQAAAAGDSGALSLLTVV